MKLSTLILVALTAPVAMAGPKNPPTFSPRSCEISNRPDFAWDAKTGKAVPVGPDRYFVRCHESILVKNKVKDFNYVYLKGDLGGYGYYVDFNEASKAAHEYTNLRKEQQ